MSKFCIDCKHAVTIGASNSNGWQCASPKNLKHENPVSGEREYRVSLCVAQREGPNPKYCGFAGVWFEAKA